MDIGVKPQHQMLWGEDIGPETDVDNPEVPRDSRPESSQREIADASSESEEEEWKYVKTKPEDKTQSNEEQNESKSQLNPNASEFYPGVPEKFPTLEKEILIAASPDVSKVASSNFDDINIPSETEFEHDISTRACDLDSVTDIDEIGHVEHDNSKSENISSSDENKIEGVSLILTPHGTDIDSDLIKNVDTNPFASDMKQPKSEESDKVDFVQDYFGKSELDFKPFESVTQHAIPDKPFGSVDLPESQIPNSFSAEISYHFNFINSHLDNSETVRSEESEKERNQLEIKEPESPANSENCSNDLIEHHERHNEIEDLPVDKTSSLLDQHASSIPTADKNEQENFIIKSEKVIDIGFIETSSDVLPLKTKPEIVCQEVEEIKLDNEGTFIDVAPTVDIPIFDDSLRTPLVTGLVIQVFNDEPVINNFVEEVLSDISQSENDIKDNDIDSGMGDFNFDSSPGQVNKDITANMQFDRDSSPNVADLEENVHSFNELNVLHGNKNIEQTSVIDDYVESLTVETAETLVHNEDQCVLDKNEDVINLAERNTCDLNTQEIDNNYGDINNETTKELQSDIPHFELTGNKIIDDVCTGTDSLEQPQNLDEHKIELADTIGPSAFSFSPYEFVENILPVDFIGLRKNDIMTTSVHESLEQDSSFEFISESAVKESVIDAVIESNNDPCLVAEEVILETVSEIPSSDTHKKLENGIDHIKSSSNLLSDNISFVNGFVGKDSVTTALETESAIIESHEVPVSSEPDLVFVEHICPTVEVRSDEASPVNKETSGFELSSVASAAGITTALGVAAVAVTTLNQQDPEPKKDAIISETKSAVKPSANKAPLGKKPMPTLTAKLSTTKSAPKVAPTKPAQTAAKPKAPAQAKPTTATSATAKRTKPVLSTTKSTLTSSAKPALSTSKPIARSTAVSMTKEPSKPTTTNLSTKPALGTTKPATRPASAPVKSTVTKTAAPSKTLPLRAPLAAKKSTVPASKPIVASKITSVTEKGMTKSTSLKPAVPPTTRTTVTKTASTIGSKPPVKLGVSAASADKLKATSPTKPAPIKAKSPLVATKRPSSATTKKPSTVLDKNAKNAVKSVPKKPAQKEIIVSENLHVEEAVVPSTNTNGHHIENGNVTPLEEVPSHIM